MDSSFSPHVLTIPPLHPEIVHKLVKAYPDMTFALNGGVESFDAAKMHLGMFDVNNTVKEEFSVMIGREAYRNPWLFAAADRLFFSDDSYSIGTRREVVERYLEYAQDMQDLSVYGSNTCSIVKPLHNAFTDCDVSGANKLYKSKLDALLKLHSSKVDKDKSMTLAEIVHQALEDTIPSSFLDEPVMS
eukprot:gene29106-36097_t